MHSFYSCCRRVALTTGIFLVSFHAHADRFYKDDHAWFLNLLQQPAPVAAAGAGAVVLYEKSSVLMNHDVTGEYMGREIHRVIRVLRKGSVDLADINAHASSTSERVGAVSNISCVTYNLEQGRLVSQKMEPDAIQQTSTKFAVQVKFSAPSVREGSIIDYSYRVVEPFTSILLADWNFQTELPKLYSELEVIIPSSIQLVIVSNRNPPFPMFYDGKKGLSDTDLPECYRDETMLVNNSYRQYRWVRRNVSAISPEPFMAATDNYTGNIQVQYTGIHSRYTHYDMPDTWEKINKILLKDGDFYKNITGKSGSVDDKAAELIQGKSTDLEKAMAIFRFVRDSINVGVINHIYAFKSMAKVLKDRSGTASEANFLLLTLLRDAGLDCEPVILSTRDRIRPLQAYPLMEQFNLTVGELTIGGKKYYLDASNRYNTFGNLPIWCYNGYARKISKDGSALDLMPGMFEEQGTITVTTEKADRNDYRLLVRQRFGQTAGMVKRAEWKEDTAALKQYVVKAVRQLPFTPALRTYSLRNKNNPDSALILEYTASVTWPAEGEGMYLNPVMASDISQNSFKSSQRNYPVEMPYAMDYQYALSLRMPPGFRVVEAPESTALEMDSLDGYTYIVRNDTASGMFNLDARLHFRRAVFSTEEYSWLKEFLDLVLDSQKKNIIIKKQS